MYLYCPNVPAVCLYQKLDAHSISQNHKKLNGQYVFHMYLHTDIILKANTNIVLDDTFYFIFKMSHKKSRLANQIHKYV